MTYVLEVQEFDSDLQIGFGNRFIFEEILVVSMLSRSIQREASVRYGRRRCIFFD